MYKKITFAGIAAVLMSACVLHSTNLGKDKAIATDASVRTIIGYESSPVTGYNHPNHILCPEPSPDVAVSVSKAIEAVAKGSFQEGDKTVSGEASGKFQLIKNVVQLGNRLGTIQLLRDEMSDLCRAYANGAISKSTYAVRLSRLDKKMVALMATELATNAIGNSVPQQDTSAMTAVAVASQANVDNAKADLKKAQDALITATDDLAKESSSTTLDKQKIADKTKAVADKQKDLYDKLTVLTKLQTADHVIISAGISGFSHYSTSGDKNTLKVNPAVQVYEMYMNSNEISSLIDACVTATDSYDIPDGVAENINSNEESKTLSEKYLKLLQHFQNYANKERKAYTAKLLEYGYNTKFSSFCVEALAAMKEPMVEYLRAKNQTELAKAGKESIQLEAERANAERNLEFVKNLKQGCIDYVKGKIEKPAPKYIEYCESLIADAGKSGNEPGANKLVGAPIEGDHGRGSQTPTAPLSQQRDKAPKALKAGTGT